jgi:type IV secretion system protein VirB9
MRALPLPILLLASASLAGCATTKWTPPEIALDEPVAATPAAPEPEPPRPVQVVELPKPLPLPGQLQRVPPAKTAPPEPADPRARVEAANMAARVQPFRSGWFNAVQVYPFADGALYQVYAAPGQVTDIALQPGEQLVGTGPVAAGDTVRWIIGDTVSGTGAGTRVHIMLKPVRADLQTNLVINTDRRTYHLELRSAERTFMASVSWSYPQDDLIALRRQNAAAEAAQPVASVALPSIENLNFRYQIEGDHPSWRPVRAFDDGRQVFIEFPAGIAQGEIPPLWIIGSQGDAQLVNYRVRGRYMVVDRLFGGAELRLGEKRQQRVRIVRSDGKPTS